MGIGMEKKMYWGVMMVVVIVFGLAGNAAGKVYHVGGDAGWTNMGVHYQKLADSETFHVGDILVFKYHTPFHNVKEVTEDAFKSCDSSNAIHSYTSGNDSITITKPGHHYFLCGAPWHCQAGQKFEINAQVSSSPSPSPSPSKSHAPSAPSKEPPSAPSKESPSAPSKVPAPSASQAAPSTTKFFAKLWLAMVVFAIFYV